MVSNYTKDVSYIKIMTQNPKGEKEKILNRFRRKKIQVYSYKFTSLQKTTSLSYTITRTTTLIY